MPKIIIPEGLKCPLTHQLIKSPARAADNKIYEWSAIEEWLQTSDISPVTGLELPSKELLPDELFNNQLEEFMEINQICDFEDFCETLIQVTFGTRSLEDLRKLNYSEEHFSDSSEKFGVSVEYGVPPLHYAAYANHVEIINFLLDNGTDINLEDGGGNTALQWAYNIRSIEAILLLLDKGAKIKEENGWTLLHCAAAEGSRYQETIRRLILAGVDSTGITDDGKTVEVIAKEWGHGELAALIPHYRQERLTRAACQLLKAGRTILSSSEPGYFKFLPKAIRYQILSWLASQGCLVSDQQSKILDYAADKKTIGQSKMQFSQQTLFFKPTKRLKDKEIEVGNVSEDLDLIVKRQCIE